MLSALPFDLLLRVASFLDVHDLIRLGQTSSFFRTFIDNISVWHQAYSTSPLLLPYGPLPFHSSADLRRTLVRAVDLECNWTAEQPCITSRKIFQIPNVPGKHLSVDIQIQLVQARYLIVLTSRGIFCYDIENVHSHEHPLASFLDAAPLNYRSSLWQDCDGTAYLAFLASHEPSFHIVVLKLCLPSNEPHFELVANILGPRDMSPRFALTRIRGDYVAVYIASSLVVAHIPSRKLFSIPDMDQSSNSSLPHRDFLLTPNHILVYTARHSILEAYSLPEPSSDSVELQGDNAPSHLIRTHVGPMDCAFTEWTYTNYQHDISDEIGAHNLVLVSLSPFRDVSQFMTHEIRLLPDGSITENHHLSPFEQKFVFAYWLGVSSNVNAARAVCFSGKTGKDLAILSMRRDVENGFPTHVRVIREPFGSNVSAYGMEFDGIRGRVCLLKDSQTVEFIDFVD